MSGRHRYTPKRSSSPALSVASSIDSCRGNDDPRYSRPKPVWSDNNCNGDSSDDENHSRRPKPRRQPYYRQNNNYKNENVTQLTPFKFATFKNTVVSKKKLKCCWTRMDWFGLNEGNYCGQDVHLKYLHLPENMQNANLNLKVEHEQDKLHFPINKNQNINEILMWMMDEFPRPSAFQRSYPNVNFVCSRIELDCIMSSAYVHDKDFSFKSRFGYVIAAVRKKGTYYMSMFYTNEEKLVRALENMEGTTSDSSIAGLMFHKNLLSDGPDEEPDITAPFDRKETELFAVDVFSVGKHSVLIQNKFKAVRSQSDLEDFANFQMFELKTAMKPYHLRNLFPKWLRCFAGNMDHVIIGVKDRHCQNIKEIEVLQTDTLLKMCQDQCMSSNLPGEGQLHPRPEVCLNLADKFFDFVRKTITEDTPDDTVYIFEFNPDKEGVISSSKLTGTASKFYKFLSDDFLRWLGKSKQ